MNETGVFTMYKICKTEKSMERHKLFQTTLLAMMKKQKYQDITVTSLCKEMQVPRKTFYRYYDTLGDVLSVVIDDVLRDAFLYWEVKPDMNGFFTYWKNQKELLDILHKNQIMYLLIERMYKRMEEEQISSDITYAEIQQAGHVGALLHMLLRWYDTGMKQTPEEMRQITKEMFHWS